LEIPAFDGSDCSTQDFPFFVAMMIGFPDDVAPVDQQVVGAPQAMENRCPLARLCGNESTVHCAPPSVVEMMASEVSVLPTAQQSVREGHAFENRWPFVLRLVPTDVLGRDWGDHFLPPSVVARIKACGVPPDVPFPTIQQSVVPQQEMENRCPDFRPRFDGYLWAAQAALPVPASTVPFAGF
jgi:hypothetical protein